MNLPKPYYQDNACTIYHANCREILPLLDLADLVLTDPPYGIGEARGKNKSRSRLAAATDYGVDSWDDEPVSPELMSLVIDQGRRAIVFGGNYYAMAPSSCWLVWDKDNGANDFADCELAWTNLPRAVRRLRYRWNGFQQEPGRRKEIRAHPTQKPLAVIKWCLSFVPEAETVIDPFMGSGTTLRAAKDTGRKAIGIEIEEKYCEIAAKRLAQEVFNFEGAA